MEEEGKNCTVECPCSVVSSQDLWLYSPQETEGALFHSENRKNIVLITCVCIYTSCTMCTVSFPVSILPMIKKSWVGT